MKTSINRLLTGVFVIFTIFHWQCEEPDTESPTIELLGKDTIYVELNGTFNEPGAIASDNKDGDLTENIRMNTDLNTDLADLYIVYYKVTDDAGNVDEATRTVIVFNEADTLAGSYNANITQTSSKIDTTYQDTLQASQTKNHYLKTTNFMDKNVEISLYANNDSLTIKKQEFTLKNDTFDIHHKNPGNYKNSKLEVTFILDNGQPIEHEMVYTN